MRTSIISVRQVISTKVDDAALTRFAEDASAWVDRSLPTSELSAVALEAIERYLTAYMITFRDPRIVDQTLSDVRERAQRSTEVSEYLAAAIALDPTGIVRETFAPRGTQYRGGFSFAEGW